MINQRFCPICGVYGFGVAAVPVGKRMAAINLRCLQGVGAAALPVRHFDVRSFGTPGRLWVPNGEVC